VLSDRVASVESIAQFAGVTKSTVYRWIRAGKLKATRRGKIYDIPFSDNSEILAAQLKKRHGKLSTAWTPREIGRYSEWHELLDEICWLIKICYSSRDDVKHKRFRSDLLFVNYLTVHEVDLSKVRQVFATNSSPSRRRVTDDLKRGWYNELSYAFPLRTSTLGLSFADITLNMQDSSAGFAFPSWRIASAYYSVYFYLRAITLQKQDGLRLQEHAATIRGFKSSLLQPLMRVIWKLPFDITYTPNARARQRDSFIHDRVHTRYNYSNHPRPPHRSALQITAHVYQAYKRKAKSRTKPSSYMLFDYLHDFRIWANYLDIDNLLCLRGPGYKTFIDQNLSLLLFFVGGISEIGYLSVFGEARYIEQVQSLYDLLAANMPELKSRFVNTPIYQRLVIYNGIGLVKGTIGDTNEVLNLVVTTPNISRS